MVSTPWALSVSGWLFSSETNASQSPATSGAGSKSAGTIDTSSGSMPLPSSTALITDCPLVWTHSFLPARSASVFTGLSASDMMLVGFCCSVAAMIFSGAPSATARAMTSVELSPTSAFPLATRGSTVVLGPPGVMVRSTPSAS